MDRTKLCLANRITLRQRAICNARIRLAGQIRLAVIRSFRRRGSVAGDHVRRAGFVDCAASEGIGHVAGGDTVFVRAGDRRHLCPVKEKEGDNELVHGYPLIFFR
ncbi:hypothetical protein D9M69_646610 [compost metagenome]